MGNRFTRNIQNVRNIDKLPLNTNEQNDLISDKKGNVYVRNLSSYERITGLKKLEDDFNTLQERLKDFDPNNDEVESIIKKINDNKKALEKKIKDVKSDVANIEIPNYEDDIKELNQKYNDINIPNYDKDIERLEDKINNVPNYENDLKAIQDDIDSIEIKDYEEDIKKINQRIDNLEIPNYDDDIKNLDDKINELNINDFVVSSDWTFFDLNGEIETNTAYKKDGENGFDCSYREIKFGDMFTKKIVRLNGNNVKHGDILFQLPSYFVKNEQTALLRVPLSYMAWVTIYPNGEIKFLLQGEREEWSKDDFFYGQIEWIE